MHFSVHDFVIEVGEAIEIEFKNIGMLPKFIMGHNLVFLK